jgi:hypothetical protein
MLERTNPTVALTLGYALLDPREYYSPGRAFIQVKFVAIVFDF